MGMTYDLGVSVKERTGSFEAKEGVLIIDGGDLIFAPATPCDLHAKEPNFTDRARRMIERRKCLERMLGTERDQLIAIEGAYLLRETEIEQIKLKRADHGIVRPGGHPGLVLKTNTDKYRFELIEKRDLPKLSEHLRNYYGIRLKD